MPQVIFDISMSLDGFVAGPNPTLQDPLGQGGMQLHEWAVVTTAWRERHGLEGGEDGPDSGVIAESLARQGAIVMGRRMFSGGAGPWDEDPNQDAWWGDDPPFHGPVFVVTHHPREPVEKEGGTTFTFVPGVEAAVERGRTAAGDKDVVIVGGGAVIQQALAAGLIDEFQLHLAPVLLGDGVRLFDRLGSTLPQVELTRVSDSPRVTHVSYRVVK